MGSKNQMTPQAINNDRSLRSSLKLLTRTFMESFEEQARSISYYKP